MLFGLYDQEIAVVRVGLAGGDQAGLLLDEAAKHEPDLPLLALLLAGLRLGRLLTLFDLLERGLLGALSLLGGNEVGSKLIFLLLYLLNFWFWSSDLNED